MAKLCRCDQHPDNVDKFPRVSLCVYMSRCACNDCCAGHVTDQHSVPTLPGSQGRPILSFNALLITLLLQAIHLVSINV